MSDAQIKLEGRKALNQEKAVAAQLLKQEEDSQRILAEKQLERQTKVKAVVHTAIDSLAAVTGVSVTARDKEALKKYAPNDLIRKHFPLGEDGLPIADVWAKSAAILELSERNAKLLKQKASSETKKQEFKKLHNVEQQVQKEVVRQDKPSEYATADELNAILRI
jgi:hypothetical protein